MPESTAFAGRLANLWQGSRARARSEPGLVAAWGLVIAFALFVLARGKDVSWDVRNYHWYNPYAFLTGRRGFDIAVAQHATYYNPLIDVPVYAGAQVMPAWLVGLLLGAVHGLNAIALYILTQRVLSDRIAERQRSWIAFAVAATGMLGGMTLGLAGVLSQDLTVSILVLASLALLFGHNERTPGTQDDLLIVAGAGLLCGIAIGLAAAVAVLAAPWRARLARLAALAAGGLLGVIIFDGSWAYLIWHETGNPIFPYFNEVFGSPLLLAASYRDLRFQPHGLAEALIYPFLFTIDGTRVADAPFRDIKLMLAYVLIPIAFVLWTARRAASDRMFKDEAVTALFAFAAASYFIWLFVFAIYRYAITLELLAPLLIVMAIDFIPVTARQRIWSAAAVLLISVAAVGWGYAIDKRPAWGDRYIAVTVPHIDKPAETMALMAGTEPMSFVIPEFPPQMPFLRIDSWLDSPQSHTRFGDRMRGRVTAHRGPIFGIFAAPQRDRALAAFAEYGLMLEPSTCQPIVTNAGPAQLADAQPLMWCALSRRALA